MNTLEQEILRIMDFDEKNLPLAFLEAGGKEKLLNTVMIVNGKVGHVKEFYQKKGQIHIYNLDGARIVPVTSLEVFLPETGIYFDKDIAIYIEKLPKKQWKKSFHPSFYKIAHLNESNLDDLELVEFLYKAKKVPFYINKMGFVYYRNNTIGLAYGEKTKSIKLKNNIHYQAILDLIQKENLPWEIQQ